MAPDTKILTVISNAEKQEEIQRRLRDQEAEKTRKLLALAMSNKDALFMTKAFITKKIDGGNGTK